MFELQAQLEDFGMTDGEVEWMFDALDADVNQKVFAGLPSDMFEASVSNIKGHNIQFVRVSEREGIEEKAAAQKSQLGRGNTHTARDCVLLNRLSVTG